MWSSGALGGRERDTPPPVLVLAGRQGGVVGRDQLLALGLSKSAIRSWLRRGLLHPIHQGVYAVGRPDIPLVGRYHAAVLAVGGWCALSHRTAAAIWELLPLPGRAIELTTTRGGRQRDPALKVHRTRFLPRQDVTEHQGLPVTTIARTLLDLADVVAPRQLDRAVEQALILRLYDHTEIEAVLNRANGRRGATALRGATADLKDTPPVVRSTLERAFLAFCAEHGLPEPRTNVLVAGYEVDAYWPDARLVVELDGRGVHGTAVAFERDRVRDRVLAVAGVRTVRVTSRQMAHDAAPLAADLDHLLTRHKYQL